MVLTPMIHASDQNPDLDQLSPTARRMLELREAVFDEWERRVRASIEAAEKLSHPLLIDTLPAFYDNIAQAITLDYPRANAAEGNSLPAEHGGERARLSSYDYHALIHEYQIFRGTLFEVLQEQKVELTYRETSVINSSIDEGVIQAVNAFSLVHATLRDSVIAALAHDLRGPLSAVAFAAEIILLSTDPAKMKQFAAKILDNVARMQGMTKELLDSMAFQAGQQVALELSNFDIFELIKEVQAQAAVGEGLRFNIVGNPPVRGWWGRDAMKRAIENIFSNAVKYGATGSPVTVKAETLHERLLLSIHNDGQPIPPEEQEHIFQLFRRARSAKQGAALGWGVGLPYVRCVAESHGGSVEIDSTLERGTTFTIDVPLDARPFCGVATLSSTT